MIGFLWRIIVGRFKEKPSCSHKWETMKRINTYGIDQWGTRTQNPVEFHMQCRCEKCGAWKAFKL